MTDNPLAIYTACVFEPDDIVEVRLLPSKESFWRKAAELPAFEATLMAKNRQRENIYLGINPRSRVGGKEAADVALARSILVDFDDITVDEARDRLQRSGLPQPTMTIASGHGVHLIWKLAEPMIDLSKWREIQKRLIAKLGSDSSIHDPPRILRLPGFANCKREPFVPCEIVEAVPSRVHA